MKAAAKPWRSKQFQFWLGRTHRLTITVRRFHTAKDRRSQVFRQWVLPCQIGGLRELSFRLRRVRPRGRPARSSYRQRALRLAPLTLMLVGLTGSAFFGQQVVGSHAVEPSRTFTTAIKTTAQKSTAPAITPLPAATPTEINIPSVNIDVDLIAVGQAPDGSIQMPPLFDWVAGWYQESPTPGQLGPAIIVGHVDTYKGISVFWRLRYIQPGALIYISRADGSTVTFKVTELRQVDQANFPTQDVYGNLNYPGLRVITCGGTFDTATGSYDQNTVVYATMVTST